MPKKFYILSILIGLVFSLFIYRVFFLSFNKHEEYKKKRDSIKEIYVFGASAPRGRILDINGNILVDNLGINVIKYHKENLSLKEEINIAKSLVKLTNYEYMYNESILKNYYKILYPDKVNKLITDEEKKLYSERKITKKEIENLKEKRITKDMINNLSKLEKYSSYFYYLMCDGFIYSNKTLLKDISDELYASIIESNLPGVFGEIEWVRTFNYGDTLKSIIGYVSDNLPKEKEYLLKRGYTLDEKIGISGLEEYYEEYLRGKKAKYKVENNNLKLISPATRGSDLVLEIDINIQLEVERIIKAQILKAKKMPNTEFYRESYALISEPLTGNIKAIAGVRLNDNKEFQDVSINVIKNAYTVGSAVKAASMAVGYKNKIIDIGSTYTDSCIKLYSKPLKCSYKKLGKLNDIKALSLSSNYYQFRIALGVSGNKYVYNMKAKVDESDFNTYRTTFKEFGLGTKTNIDLPNESIGLEGKIIAPDLLLNLSIGQYDLYTPASLLQYINTIANNGNRLKLNIMHSIKSNDKIKLENKPIILNKVTLEDKYMNRIKMGLNEVMKRGTGYWYINNKINAAGKTGTSESFIDSDYDGKMDSFVLSNTFLMYAPFDKPKYSIVVISPNTSNLNGKSKYRAPVNRLIARNINDFLFPTS